MNIDKVYELLYLRGSNLKIDKGSCKKKQQKTNKTTLLLLL